MSRCFRDVYQDITVDDLLVWLDLDAAVAVWAKTWTTGRTNEVVQPWQGYIPPVGTWRFNPRHYEFEVLCLFDPHTLTNSESDVEGRRALVRSPEGLVNSYSRYMEWRQAGLIPPPITVYRHSDTRRLTSGNRRRWLVASDLDLPILGWFSETGDGKEKSIWQWQVDHNPDPGSFGDNRVRRALRKRFAPVMATVEGA